MKYINNKRSQGFTIIEVLIVLAIAGLIMLIVFLAVPALQRSTRNNGRQSEASRFSSSIANFVSNNQGTLPGYETGAFVAATAQTDGTSIITDFGTFKYFTGIAATAVGSTTNKIVAGQVTVISGVTTATAVSADGLVIDDEAVCGSPSSGGMVTTTGTARQLALVYTTESASGNYNQVCIQTE